MCAKPKRLNVQIAAIIAVYSYLSILHLPILYNFLDQSAYSSQAKRPPRRTAFASGLRRPDNYFTKAKVRIILE